jgi:hypothetical protein
MAPFEEKTTNAGRPNGNFALGSNLSVKRVTLENTIFSQDFNNDGTDTVCP